MNQSLVIQPFPTDSLFLREEIHLQLHTILLCLSYLAFPKTKNHQRKAKPLQAGSFDRLDLLKWGKRKRVDCPIFTAALPPCPRSGGAGRQCQAPRSSSQPPLGSPPRAVLPAAGSPTRLQHLRCPLPFLRASRGQTAISAVNSALYKPEKVFQKFNPHPHPPLGVVT